MDKLSRLNPLLEVLKSSPRRVNKILIQKEQGAWKIGAIIQAAKAESIPYLFVPRHKLDQLAPGHQGAVAYLAAKEFVSLKEIISSAECPFLVFLDEIEDPQNLGAIIRSAEGAGVDGIILPERRSAGLTETVASVSAGALEHLKIARVVNLARTMDEVKEKGLWLIGAEGSGDDRWYEFDYTLPVGIVLGSEGKGLRPLIKTKCDKVLSIPLYGKLNSLNVAAAAAVFFFEVIRQRTAPGSPWNAKKGELSKWQKK
jgi:23S rRNA (guanosine2251-2'-O)-methyltransferase